MPEPRPESLGDLAATVKAIGADMGVAFDGDADRSIFVDENGEIYWGDKTFAIIIKQYLIKNPGAKIVTPVSSSTLIKDTVEAYKGELIWTKVGSVTVSQKMKELNAKLGGEENGGVFYGPHQAVRDGAMTTALLLRHHGGNWASHFLNSWLSNRSTSLRKEKSSAQTRKKRFC